MSTPVTRANFRIDVGYTQDNGNPIAPSTLSSVWPSGDFPFTQGTGAGQVDLLFLRQVAIATGGTATLDLDGGLLDLNNEAIAFARVKFIALALVPGGATGSNDVTLMGAAANVVKNITIPLQSDGTSTPIGGARTMTAVGWPVSPGTGDKLVINNNDGAKAALVNVAIGGNAT